MSNDVETRSSLEFRVAAGTRKLEGLAALYGTETRIGGNGPGGFAEQIAPTAFTDSLASRADVLALVDHAPDRLLGRVSSGTLRLASDTRGLAFELDLPDTQLGRDVLTLAQRGDLGGMSFGFICPKGGDAWAGDKRTLRNVSLREVSIVTSWPAYAGTVVAAARARAAACARRRYLDLML